MQTNKYAIAYLNAVFGYQSGILDAPVTYRHRMSDKEEKIVQKPVAKVEKKVCVKNKQKIIDYIRFNPDCSSVEIAKSVCLTRGRVSGILTKLYESRYVSRFKTVTPTGTAYVYRVA